MLVFEGFQSVEFGERNIAPFSESSLAALENGLWRESGLIRESRRPEKLIFS
jgi:hypothetical protein